jgi:hypothetical protein
MTDDVTIRFGADTDGLEDGLASLRSAVSGVTPDLKKLSEGIGEAAQRSAPATGAFAQMAKGLSDGLGGALPAASAGLRQLGADAGQQAGAVKASLDLEIKALQEQLALKKTIYDGEARLKNISEQEKLALTRAALQQEFEAHKALLEQEAALEGLSVKQKEEAVKKKAALEANYLKQVTQIGYRAAEDQDKIWQDLSSRIGSSMSSSISGLLQHTTNFREAVRQMTLSVIQYFVGMGTQWIASFAVTIAKNVATHLLGEEAMTAATQLGTTQRAASVASGAVADTAAKAAVVIKSILASSAETFAGVFGFLSPLLGPGAAGPASAAAASVAGMASVASFDIGAWNVPHDQLAMVHKSELVMTASQGDAFRSLISNGSNAPASAPQVHAPVNFNVQALDSQGVANFLQGNGRAIMKAMAAHVRDGAHLGLKGLNPA